MNGSLLGVADDSAKAARFSSSHLQRRQPLSLKTASQRRQTAAPLIFDAGNICQLNQAEDAAQ